MDSLIQYINFIAAHWYLGLMLSGTVEGLSLPFPSQPLVLYIGHIINTKNPNMLMAASFFAFPYTIASCIPYFIGSKYGKFLPRISPRFEKYLSKGEHIFTKYGEVSVLLTRPFAVGNYISYLAGIYKMNFLKYFCLTFLGIFTWALAILYLGGQVELTFTMLIKSISKSLEDGIIILASIMAVLGLASLWLRYPRKANQNK